VVELVAVGLLNSSSLTIIFQPPPPKLKSWLRAWFSLWGALQQKL